MMAIDDRHENREDSVEAIDHVTGRTIARSGGEAADVDEHDANAPRLADLGATDRGQPLDHLRGNVLAEQIGHAIAGRGRFQRAGELRLELLANQASEA